MEKKISLVLIKEFSKILEEEEATDVKKYVKVEMENSESSEVTNATYENQGCIKFPTT